MNTKKNTHPIKEMKTFFFSLITTKNHYQSIQVFSHPFLEWFTHVHPVIPALIWIPIIGFCFFQSIALKIPFLTIFLYTGYGLFIWTFTEYSMHRWIFHYEGKSAAAKRIHFLFHGLHHADPKDPTRLVMPPIVSLTLGGLYAWIFYQLLGFYFLPFFAGFIIGYLAYDYTHYAIHHFKPSSKIGIYLKKHHMHHHFINPNACIGVSNPLWDFVFKTLPAPRPKKPTSSSCHTFLSS